MNANAVVDWVRRALPYSGPTITGLQIGEAASNEQKAAFQVVAALEAVSASGPIQESVFELGTSLNALGTSLGERDPHAAAAMFCAAYFALTSLHDRESQPDHYKDAIGFAFANLKKKYGVDKFELEDPGPEGLLNLSPLVGAAVESAVSMPDGEEALARPVDEDVEPDEQAPDVVGRTAESARHLIGILSAGWGPTSRRTDERLANLKAYLSGQLERSGILARDLGALLDEDIAAISAAGYLEFLPEGLEDLKEVAREFRRFAFQGDILESESRQRWLISAVANYASWKEAGLTTNEPQVLIDLMGYLSAVMIFRRYRDTDRDLLLDSAETIVRLASTMAPVVFTQFDYIRTWLLSGSGLYLLLAGPNPTSPSQSYYDPRIQADDAPAGRGLKRKLRRSWPELLLEQWRGAPDTEAGAVYALASLAGWDLRRADWLVGAVYGESTDAQRDLSADHWRDVLAKLLSRVHRVRVAKNPWEISDPASTRGTMILSDPSGRFQIPDGVLTAATAQGLVVGDDTAVSANGAPFEGRRVPTYLITDRFGPQAILKIDRREKVLREVENFHSCARRLHQSHRPSECVAFPMDMYLGEDGAALRAIQTSYVFEEDDKPLTLGSWLRSSSASDAAKVVEGFFQRTLRPWLAYVRRDRVDLRDEYPVLRPEPVQDKQSPENWAGSELAKLEKQRVCEYVGFTLDRTNPGCPWLTQLEGHAEAFTAMSGADAVNPLWLASELAEIGSGVLAPVVDSLGIGLRDYDTLLCLAHGDLHLDNVLCASSGAGLPRTVLIDFESAHRGHVCKDIARVEASMLCQVFALEEGGAAEALASWFAQAVHEKDRDGFFNPGPPNLEHEELNVIASVMTVLRSTINGCGQGLWPIRRDEYLIALFGALLPIVRYSTVSETQARRALLFSTVVATELRSMWAEIVA